MSNRINQLIEELREQCIAERRPLAVFVADETGEGTEYESCILTPMHLQRPLKNDKITPLVSLLNKKFRIEFEYAVRSTAEKRFWQYVGSELCPRCCGRSGTEVF